MSEPYLAATYATLDSLTSEQAKRVARNESIISSIPTLVTFPEPTNQSECTIVDTSPTPSTSPVGKRQKKMRCDGNVCFFE